MPTFLLWNVQRKPLDALVLGLVDRYAVDVVVLVEHASVLTRLAEWMARVGFQEHIGNERFALFARNEIGLSRLLVPDQHSRYDCWQVTAASGVDGLLGIVHGQDVRNYPDSNTRAVLFRQLAVTIESHERQLGHCRTVIVGDFNASPHSVEMVAADGMHALGVQQVRERFTRSTNEVDAGFFYNPMWRKYGHGRDAGSATYYHLGTKAVEYCWHMFDQVLTRPESAARLPEDRIQILREIGGLPLLDPRGNPDTDAASDHLPLIFFWDL